MIALLRQGFFSIFKGRELGPIKCDSVYLDAQGETPGYGHA